MIEDYGDVQLAFIQNKGRGLLAKRAFAVGERVASSPVLVCDTAAEVASVFNTPAGKYVFHWPYTRGGAFNKELNAVCIVLGLGSLANHDAARELRLDF